ncbi:MAG: CheY-like chemotaxis protein [Phenylobacterium sp.]|jgi:CheY-like chemotaxis protein
MTSSLQNSALKAEQSADLDLALSCPHQILLVEDNFINQMVALAILEGLGYQCDVADNGQEALNILQQQQYTLIFMDILMPVMDGITATKAIIDKYGEDSPKIVAMTANVFEKDKNQCFDAGMVDFIAKPIEIDNICRVLKKFA